MTTNAKRKFFESFRQSLLALAFNVFGIVAGTIIAFNVGVFKLAPWVIAVYPAILSVRGVIAGLFCGRLSTGLHLGTVQPRFSGNTKSFRLLFQAILVLALEASIAMSMIAMVFSTFFLGIPVSDFLGIISAIMATMALSMVIISPLTMFISFLSFKRGLDPDIVLYPIESTMSDVLITLTYIAVVSLFLHYGVAGQSLIAFAGLGLFVVAMYLLFKNRREKEFVKTIRESIFTLAFVALIVNVTGSTLGKIAEVVGGKLEIYTVYPALIDTLGDVGAVVGSTATTKLALGTLKSSFSSIRNHVIEISSVWVASLTMFFLYSILSLIIQGAFTLQNFLKFSAQLLISNVVAASFIILISYLVAILTFQKGLDPDNFVIPIESSLADSITTFSLLLALALIH